MAVERAKQGQESLLAPPPTGPEGADFAALAALSMLALKWEFHRVTFRRDGPIVQAVIRLARDNVGAGKPAQQPAPPQPVLREAMVVNVEESTLFDVGLEDRKSVV